MHMLAEGFSLIGFMQGTFLVATKWLFICHIAAFGTQLTVVSYGLLGIYGQIISQSCFVGLLLICTVVLWRLLSKREMELV